MSERPAGALEIRSARQVGVSFPNRTIELVVMPYEEETLVEYKGRMVTEVCSAGAFDGIERRANRVRVNLDHDIGRTIGRAVAFHPSRTDGLVAEVRIANTQLGNDALELAADECLDASAGFLPMPGGEKWETRSRRRINKAWLGHIAMTSVPAYEGSRVLDVRQAGAVTLPEAPAARPNLEAYYASLLEERYALLDR